MQTISEYGTTCNETDLNAMLSELKMPLFMAILFKPNYNINTIYYHNHMFQCKKLPKFLIRKYFEHCSSSLNIQWTHSYPCMVKNLIAFSNNVNPNKINLVDTMKVLNQLMTTEGHVLSKIKTFSCYSLKCLIFDKTFLLGL